MRIAGQSARMGLIFVRCGMAIEHGASWDASEARRTGTGVDRPTGDGKRRVVQIDGINAQTAADNSREVPPPTTLKCALFSGHKTPGSYLNRARRFSCHTIAAL